MKTYRLLLTYILYTIIPGYLSYLAFKASIISNSQFPIKDGIPPALLTSLTFVVSCIIIYITMGSYLDEYIKE